jgi:hypothetical protein
MASADSARYDDAKEVKPKNRRTASTGAVIDPRPSKYPSTLEFASSKEENQSKVEAGIKKRRPGGSLRAQRGLGCPCGQHPCRCGTEKVREYHNTHGHQNVNV